MATVTNDDVLNAEELLAGARSRLDNVIAETQEKEAHIESLRGEIAQFEAIHTTLGDQVGDLQGRADALQTQINEAHKNLDNLEQQSNKLSTENAQLNNEISDRRAVLEQRSAELDAQSRQLDNTKSNFISDKAAFEGDKKAFQDYKVKVMGVINGTDSAGDI